MVVTKGAALLALYDVAREFMSITSAKIDTREERERDWESYRGVFTYFSQPKQGKHGGFHLYLSELAFSNQFYFQILLN